MIDSKNNIIWHNGPTTNFNSYIGYNKDKKVELLFCQMYLLKVMLT